MRRSTPWRFHDGDQVIDRARRRWVFRLSLDRWEVLLRGGESYGDPITYHSLLAGYGPVRQVVPR